MRILSGTTLYKKKKTGIVQWTCHTERDGDDNYFIIKEYGRYGGAVHIDTRQVHSTKKFSAQQMSQRKYDQAYTAKKKTGYTSDLAKAQDDLSNKPMLLHSYDKHKSKVTYPCFVQPKLNGIRATHFDHIPGNPDCHPKLERPKMLSREGNPFPKLDHITKAINRYFDEQKENAGDTQVCHMDGEIYAHGYKVSEIVEAVKGENKEVFDQLKFYVFDYPDISGTLSFKHRLQRGLRIHDYGDPYRDRVWEQVETKICRTEGELDAYYEACLEAGLEGIVIRNPHAMYEWDSRSSGVIKRKPVLSEEFPIIRYGYDISPKGDRLIKFYCELEDGAEFPVVPAWGHEKRAEVYQRCFDTVGYFNDHFLGKPATVEFREWTKYDKPFHPVLISVRDYE